MQRFIQLLSVVGVVLVWGLGPVSAQPAAKAQDPIVGRWLLIDRQRSVLDFRPDGSLLFYDEKLARLMNAGESDKPAARQEVEQAVKEARASKHTWKKVGKIYRLDFTNPRGMKVGGGAVKLRGKRLIYVRDNGKPIPNHPGAKRM